VPPSNCRSAIDLLRETVQYDFAYTHSFDFLYPAYICGLAHLEWGDGRSAAREFQKLIDNPGLCWEFITGPLARLQLARAEKLMGDNASAENLTKNSLIFGKMPTPMFPSVDKPRPSTRSSKIWVAELDDYCTVFCVRFP
jgi:hypothetical protein